MAQARVFVVDDESEILAFMKQVITNAGYQAETFTSGDEVIDKMQASTPDMVFLDVQMPGVNGFQVLKAMRQAGKQGRCASA